MPGIHIMPRWTDIIIPSIVINMSTKSIFLCKCEGLGCLELIDTEICEITTSSDIEQIVLEVIAEHPENPLPFREGQFICSPADISVLRKVDTQELEVSENI